MTVNATELRSYLPAIDRIAKDLYGIEFGRDHRALCPEHDDHTPSLYHDRKKNRVFCTSHLCYGEKGADAFKLVQLRQNCSFPEACQRLAQAYAPHLLPRASNSENGRRPSRTASEKSVTAAHARAKLEREGWQFEAEYDYAPGLRKVRFLHVSERQRKGKPKKICIWEHSRDGIWYTTKGGRKNPVYLNRVARQLDQLEAALGVEGENKADAAADFGYAAFSIKELTHENAVQLADVTITIWRDKDEEGLKNQEQAIEILRPHARSIRIVDPLLLQDLPESGDIIDAIRSGYDQDRVAAVVESAQLIGEGCPVNATNPSERSSHQGGAGVLQKAVRESQATKLIKLASDLEYFHAPDNQPYVSFVIDGHNETHGVRSRGFKVYLQSRFYSEMGHALTGKALQDALGVLESKSTFEGEEHGVQYRVGEVNGSIYLDLGGNAWDAIEVNREGWRVVSKPPVKFRRNRGMLPLPRPVREPDASANFAKLVNIKREDGDLMLVTGWLLATMRPQGPFPILVLNSEHGSGKTTTSRLLRNLLDPNEAPMRAQPKDERDLMIAALNGWILGFDNLSHLPGWLSDALCRLSTGGGFGTRELYTNDDEIVFNAQRPVILNGIDELATRADLMDRAIVIELSRIPAGKRLTEKEFWHVFGLYRPGILGYFLDGMCCALANIGSVKAPTLPRMADFAELVVAAESSLGWRQGSFLKAYAKNREDSADVAIDASPIARYLLRIGNWTGTATALMSAIEGQATDLEKISKSWPKCPRALSSAIRRLTPILRECGLDVVFDRDAESRSRERLIILKLIDSD